MKKNRGKKEKTRRGARRFAEFCRGLCCVVLVSVLGGVVASTPWRNFRLTSESKGVLGGVVAESDERFVWREVENGVALVKYNDRNASEVVVPSEVAGKPVTSIGDSAFGDCDSLISLTLPAGLTTIGDSAFGDCDSLVSLTLPAGVTSIGDGAFSGCRSLSSLEVSEENRFFRSVDGVLFSADGKTLVCYPAGKTATEYALPAGLTTIGDGAFWDCRSLSSLTLPAGLTSIGDGAFFGCESLISLTLPAGLTTIGDSAFMGCSSLVSLTLPAGLTLIGDRAFWGCRSLSSLTLPAGLTSIGDDAFWDCRSLSSLEVSEENRFFRSVDGVLFTADGKTLVCYPAAKDGSE